MKKLLSIVMCMTLMLSSFTAFADAGTTERVKDVLIKVKSKVEVPDLFTQFESSQYSDEKERNQYSFIWNNDDYSVSMNINADEKGNISYYYYRDKNVFANPDLKKLSDVKKEEAFSVGDSFIKKLAPECFENENDKLVYFEKNSLGEISGRSTYYNFTYKRLKNGIPLKDNIAEVSVFAGNKNSIIVSSVSINYDYSASFEEEKTEIENPKEKYATLFPVEMIYERDNYYYRTDSEKKTELIYRIKNNEIGYISAYSGEELIPDSEEYFRGMSGGSATFNQAMKEEFSADSMLSPVEIKELETISGLKPADEIKNAIAKMPYLEFSDNLEKISESLTKEDKRYIFNASYRFNDENKETNLRYTAEAESGKILSVYYNIYDYTKPYSDDSKKTLSEDQWLDTDKKVSEITDYVAKNEIKTCLEPTKEYYGNTAYYTYIRTVNNIKYPANSIGVAFNVEENRIKSFDLNFTNDIFDDPENAIDEKTAYEKILEIAPLSKIYIKSDKIYKLCYSLEQKGNVKINAFSGEKTDKDFSDELQSYNDIENHWSKNAVEALADVGIAFPGGSFMPDSAITQSDILRLFAAGINYKSYMYADEKELYELMINDKIITEAEKNPSAPIKREDAFVYLIRFADLDTVAKLSSIFKTDYADGNEITKEKIGYAAILSGFGVIEGNGGYLKPQKNITRAEAASLLYKYLSMCSY